STAPEPASASSRCDTLSLVFALLAETAAEEGKKTVLMMLAVGCVFIGVIAVGELSHWLRHRR
ncbi:MAG: hypothetical protein ACXVRQ_08715, partial [Gaiellaceae bacterium]